MKTSLLFWAFFAAFGIAVDADRYHQREEPAKPFSEQPTLYSSDGNAGIWDDTDWIAIADDELDEAIRVASNVNTNKAKNVIFFIGDGMGLPTLAAARLYNAANRKLKKREIYLTWEKFPHVGLSRTYNVDRSTPDSAGTATAYLCGVKANYETIGVTDKVQARDCSAVNEKTKVRSILKEAITEGAYAHVSHRDWEAYFPTQFPGQENCTDIAKQLVTENKEIRVILGGGRQMFLPNYANADYNNETGKREDNEDLIEVWRAEHKQGKFVSNKTEFDKIAVDDTDYLFGLFSKSHMDYEVDRNPSEQPSLTEMTEKAIRLLQRGPKGYFLFVEGGRIDLSHHDGIAFNALNDTVALSDAVQKAIDITDISDTLIVVSADHSHVFTFGGYGSFKQSIFDVSDKRLADDGKPYLQLSYANGPGFYKHRTEDGTSVNREVPRKNLTGDDEIFTPGFLQDSGVPLDSETHGGEDVAIFARGPMAHLIHGVHEQNYINRFMKFSSCMGRDSDKPHCVSADESTTVLTDDNNEASTTSRDDNSEASTTSRDDNSEATTASVNLFLAVLVTVFNVVRQMSACTVL